VAIGKNTAHLELSIGLKDFVPDEGLQNVSELRYADKVREKARKKRVEKARKEGEEEKKRAEAESKKAIRIKNAAWSTKKDLKEKKGIRKEKKRNKISCYFAGTIETWLQDCLAYGISYDIAHGITWWLAASWSS